MQNYRVIFNCPVLAGSELNHVNFIWIHHKHINNDHKNYFLFIQDLNYPEKPFFTVGVHQPAE